MTEARDFSAESDASAESRPPRISFHVDQTFRNDEAIEDPPENYVAENIANHVMRPRAMSHHLSSTKVPSRSWLTVQAKFWRACMRLGMQFHGWPRPRPPKPSFVHNIQTDTIPIRLLFYVPKDYHTTFRDKPDHRYPVVVSFHGGGFTMGDPTDDRYYARIFVKHTSAIFVSVGYRLSPEHPFPIPVDDGVEALLYLATHADSYHIDPSQIVLTGFSAGANLSLTIPFRLAFHTDQANPRKYSTAESAQRSPEASPDVSRVNTQQDRPPVPALITTSPEDEHNSSNDSSSNLLPKTPTTESRSLFQKAATNAALAADISHVHTKPESLHSANASSLQLPNLGGPSQERPRLIQAQSSSRISRLLTTTQGSVRPPSSVGSIEGPKSGYEALKILSIIAWYPLLDWTSSRSAKRRSAINPAKTLSPMFTSLFDYSYLPPPDFDGNHVSPYASPGLAPDKMLFEGLPRRIQLWLCEYDMLLQEGKEFSERLENLHKDIETVLVEGVPHGWDKSPNPFRDQSKIDKLYIQAAERLEATFQEARQKPTSVAGERIGLGGIR